MKRLVVLAAVVLAPAVALAQAPNPWDLAKKAAGNAATAKLEKEINTRLLDEGRKNQCSFKTNSDQLEAGCDKKMKNLSNALIAAKKQLNAAGVTNFKFEVSGHTDSSGNAQQNKELSGKRAAVIVKELISRGIPEGEILSVGMGSERPLVKPDDTPAKKAKNRRYELQVRL
jgi:outer membrane protein OmpA-like peptidoglycan-associated protein